MMAFAATFKYKIARYQSSRWNLFQLLCFDIQHNLHACCLGNAQVDILPCIPSLTLLWNVSLARQNLLAQIEALKGMQRLGIKPNWEDQFITEGYCVCGDAFRIMASQSLLQYTIIFSPVVVLTGVIGSP